MTNEENIKLVEDNILLRLDPKIYAFITNTVPNQLKIGDTSRPVDVRLDEWRKLLRKRLGQDPVITKIGEFPALLSPDHYFRDYSVHSYLEGIGKHRMNGELAHKYSVEFFENTNISDVQEAINAIRQDYGSGELNKRFVYYNVADSSHAEAHGANDKEWNLRPNQQEVVDNFLKRPDEKKLLMYAVMRFGKSFTAMYCALAKKARKVLIVSAKADVKGEWQKT
ncbi:MAG: restriction endonuclease, partial [Clostridia bacterium]|nr:restriction endonuclease [Clostridia bacterium]